jgi:alkanesulfonate monooxygenase SsuD/methylene tetrahydromethanopterin reductase-like flavin-dependent oxidoreductase (luciferase family)
MTAIALPGVGHVIIGRAARGFGFAAFTLVFAWLTTKFAAPDASFVGRHAAGLFVWALSLTDVYRIARLDEARSAANSTPSSPALEDDAASVARINDDREISHG